MTNLIEKIKQNFRDKRIVIVGDLVADQFLHGTIARVSREAPVFILRHDETETLPGGAANAALNVATLGGKAVLVGLIGTDFNGKALLANLRKANVNCDSIIASDTYQTTTKVRVLAGQHYAPRQQMIRIDYENRESIDDKLKIELKKNFAAAVSDADAIIIADYNYGVTSVLIEQIRANFLTAGKIPILVDSRYDLQKFAGATAATPNQEEVEQILGENFTIENCVELCRNLKFESLLMTRGNKGMLLIEKDCPPLSIEAVGAKEPVDVTGAGDTVIAAFALGLAANLTFREAAKIANHAGGIVVMKKGTASVSFAELIASLEKADEAEQNEPAAR